MTSVPSHGSHYLVFPDLSAKHVCSDGDDGAYVELLACDFQEPGAVGYGCCKIANDTLCMYHALMGASVRRKLHHHLI